MTAASDDFVAVVALDDLPVDAPHAARVNGRPVVVVRLSDGSVRAVSANCPHALGDLGEGLLVRDQIICPQHHYRYDLRSGACLHPRGEGGRLTPYPVEIRGGMVWVQAPAPAWW